MNIQTAASKEQIKSINEQILTYNKICKILRDKHNEEDICYLPLHLSHTLYKWISYISIDQVSGLECEIELIHLGIISDKRAKQTNGLVLPINLPIFDLNGNYDCNLLELVSEVMMESLRGINSNES